jgi:hypothetical protein
MTSNAWARLAMTAACAAPLALASASHAASFLIIRSAPDAVTVLDPAAVERTGRNSISRAWTVTVQKSLVADAAPQPGYVRTLNEYDCSGRKVLWRTFTVYSRFGSAIMKRDNPARDLASPAPGSDGEAGLKAVCDGMAADSAVSAGSLGQLVIGLIQAWDPPLSATPAPPISKPPALRPSRRP